MKYTILSQKAFNNVINNITTIEHKNLNTLRLAESFLSNFTLDPKDLHMLSKKLNKIDCIHNENIIWSETSNLMRHNTIIIQILDIFNKIVKLTDDDNFNMFNVQKNNIWYIYNNETGIIKRYEFINKSVFDSISQFLYIIESISDNKFDSIFNNLTVVKLEPVILPIELTSIYKTYLDRKFAIINM